MPARVRTPFRTFTNRKGRTFAVRVVPRGARYGSANCLVNDEPGDYGTLVEFYDTTLADDSHGTYATTSAESGFGPMGQFVSRYYLATLLGTDGYGRAEGGLCLDGGHPEVWAVDADTMVEVRAWLTTVDATLTAKPDATGPGLPGLD